MKIEFTVYGRPAPQGSKRHVGNGVMIESSKHVKPWRVLVHAAARQAIEEWERAVGVPWSPLDEALRVRMVFTMPKPKSAPKSRQTWPCRLPDLSKLVRSTEDALTNAGLWRDDARVVEYVRTAKVYPNEDAEALTSPGVRITVEIIRGNDGRSAACGTTPD